MSVAWGGIRRPLNAPSSAARAGRQHGKVRKLRVLRRLLSAGQTRRKSSPSTLELQRPVVFPEGPQIGFEKPESSLCIDRVNAGRSKVHYSTLLFPYNLLRVFYVTRRFGEIINFTAHYGSPVYKAPPQLCLALN